MPISAQDVKLLREMTGAGILECKKTLEETAGDIEKAVTLLRERGIVKAEKKASRIAAEGLCSYRIDGNKAVLFELNSETDFVAKNAKFVELIDLIAHILIKGKAKDTAEALDSVFEGKSLKTIIDEYIAIIGEKLSLRRVTVLKKSKEEIFGAYKHMGGKIVSLSLIQGGNEEVAKNIAMHVAASNPLYLNTTLVDEHYKANELHIITELTHKENLEDPKPKPAHILDNIILGRLTKQLEAGSLVDQNYVKEPTIKVKQYLAQNKATVVSFLRLAVGEGLEKRNDDFASEVAAQVSAASK
ncbi:MAG: translation elongation factor Ts [Acholeplasmatales bacterium]|jgi:elongation factor Ts|nr:translation elongation factor Ts [Acholeplasmatales bacterium]